MALTGRKRLVLAVFCLGSVIQGMCSTYFVSILTTIERLYHIQSKTAGALMSATELGQIIGSLLIAYYGRRGNKPRWLAFCMALTASAALLSTSPHFLFNTHQYHSNNNSLSTKPPLADKQQQEPIAAKSVLLANIGAQQLCRLDKLHKSETNATSLESTLFTTQLKAPGVASLELDQTALKSQRIALAIFAFTLLVVGLSCTSIVTIGFPLVDDYVSKQESPMVFGLTIALKVFGPALGFLLGSFCMRYDVNLLSPTPSSYINQTTTTHPSAVGAWWLGPILISVPLFILAATMYILSHFDLDEVELTQDDLEDITYQAAEDHSLGGSNEFGPNVLSAEVLDITSSLSSSFSNEASSSKEVLQTKDSKLKLHRFHASNFKSNISLGRPIITRANLINDALTKSGTSSGQPCKINSVVVHHYGNSRSTNFINDEAGDINSPCIAPSPSSSSSSLSLKSSRQSSGLTMNLYSSLSRLFNNKLLILRTLSGVFHILPIAGFYTFLPKYLSEQFQVAPPNASAISGLFGILFVGIGTLLGGTIVRVFNINSKFMTRWIAASALMYSIGMLVLMNLGCPKNQIIHSESNLFIPEQCIKFCECSNDLFNPVCLNGTTFIAPCTAGCQSYSINDEKITYQNCGCSNMKEPLGEFIIQPNLEATEGRCSVGCDNFIWYIMIFSICTIIHSSSEVGGMIFNLRCVDEEDRTLALGLNTFSQSLLGTIPCSILYGTLIDFTCIYWDKVSYLSDGKEMLTRGACRAYQNDKFHYYLHGMTALVMFIAFIIDSIVGRHSNSVNFYMENESNSNVTIDLKKSREEL